MGSIGRRLEALEERRLGMDDAAEREARDLIAAEAIKRVSDEDLDVMVEMVERMPGAGGEEIAAALREKYRAVWDRYEATCREVAQEMAREL